jgi:protein-L-isoaspartate O-methyltransferase
LTKSGELVTLIGSGVGYNMAGVALYPEIIDQQGSRG